MNAFIRVKSLLSLSFVLWSLIFISSQSSAAATKVTFFFLFNHHQQSLFIGIGRQVFLKLGLSP